VYNKPIAVKISIQQANKKQAIEIEALERERVAGQLESTEDFPTCFQSATEWGTNFTAFSASERAWIREKDSHIVSSIQETPVRRTLQQKRFTNLLKPFNPHHHRNIPAKTVKIFGDQK